MNFDLTNEQKMMKESARRLMEQEIEPLVAQQEAKGVFLECLYAF